MSATVEVLSAFERRLDPASSAPVAVGFSGGGDSLMALLQTKAWADRVGRPVIAFTVDHGLQTASAAWTEQCALVAAELNIAHRTLVWRGAKPSTGVPAAARAARLRLLAEAARRAGARVIVTGHTADDLLESDWMREQGSMLGAMSEWTPSPVWPEGRGLFHFRPLLGMSRADIRAALAAQGRSWIDDPANEDMRFGRARARAALNHPSRREGEGPTAERSEAGARGRGYGAPEGTSPRTALTQWTTRRGRNPSPSHSVPLTRDLWAPPAPFGRGVIIDSFNTIRLDRADLRALSHRDAERLLGAACLCAGGGDRPPRGDRLRALVARARADAPFTATLRGARIQADPYRLTLVRNAGEAARGGLAPLVLRAGETAVWDGRFELAADRPAMIQALAGKASRLSKAERRALLGVHPATRPGLPVVINPGETVTCPLLAEGSGVHARPLSGDRLAAACGGISQERDLEVARMANPGATPYVGAESYEGDD